MMNLGFGMAADRPSGRAKWMAPLLLASIVAGCGGRVDVASTCTVDAATGLTWQVVSSAVGDFANLSALVMQANGVDKPCGYTDWRLPTARELMSLTGTPGATGVVAKTAAAGMSGRYWSGESVVGASNNAWVVDADNAGAVSFDAKAGALKVRLVRGGTPAAACNDVTRLAGYTDRGDGTVADTPSKLMWKKCSEGLSDNSCATGGLMSFSSALSLADQVSAANNAVSLGYSDWRLPNRDEMASLLDRACNTRPAIATTLFPATQSVSYATSTPDANSASLFWYVDFAQGAVAIGDLTNGKALRLVRTVK